MVTVVPVPSGGWMETPQGPVSYKDGKPPSSGQGPHEQRPAGLGLVPLAPQQTPWDGHRCGGTELHRLVEGLHRMSPKTPFPGVLNPAVPSSSSVCCIPGTVCHCRTEPSASRRGRGMGQTPVRRRGAAPNSSQGSSSRQRGARRLWEPPARPAGPSGSRRYGC